MTDIPRIKRNVKKMVDSGAAEGEIDAYLSSEGVTAEDLRSDKVSYGENIARRVASGLSAGFADEFAAKMDELTGRGNYAENVAKQRAIDDAFFKSNPVAATTAEIAGGVFSPVNKPLAAGAAMARLGPVASILAQGGAIGALSGAGNSTEGNRLQGGVTGGLLGAGFGAGLPALAQGFKAGTSNVLNRFRAPQTRAAGALGKAFVRDGLTPDAAMARLGELGDNAAIADLGGNVRGLAETITQMPGAAVKAAQELTERQFGARERIVGAALNAIGVGSLDELVAARSAAARPLYEAAFKVPDTKLSKQITSPAIERLLADPDLKRGINAGMRVIQKEGTVTGEPLYLADYAVRRNPKNGQFELDGKPTLRLLDAAKRGLDQMIQDGGEGIRNPTTNQLTQLGRAIENQRKLLVSELDRLTTVDGKSLYKQAREAWGGPSDAIEALSLIEKTAAKARDGSDITGRLFGSPDARETLRKLFPDQDSFNKFASTMARERVFAETNRAVMGNSRTGFRTAAQADLQGDAMDGALQVMQNPTMGQVVSSGVGAVRRAFTSPPVAVADELAPMLFSQDQAIQRSALNALRQRVALGTVLRPVGQAALTGATRVGGYSGGLLGGSNQ